MGYSFTFDPPSDYAVSGCAFNNWQMNYVRLVLVEAGAITGNGLSAALSAPGLETTPDTLPAGTFMSNGGAHVTAAQALLSPTDFAAPWPKASSATCWAS